MIEFPVTKKDLRIEWFSRTGAGGQHRNKHQNCCRITHKDSGIKAICQDHKERNTNIKIAFRRLAKKLIAKVNSEKAKERYHNTEVIRTYNKPNNRVVDKASGFVQRYDEVMKDISGMIDARRISNMEE